MIISTAGALMFMAIYLSCVLEKCLASIHFFFLCSTSKSLVLAIYTLAISEPAEDDYPCWSLARTRRL